MSRKIEITVTVSWTTQKGWKVEGVQHTSVVEASSSDVSDTISAAGSAAEMTFRRMLAIYDEDHV